jgi:hypothetical protein
MFHQVLLFKTSTINPKKPRSQKHARPKEILLGRFLREAKINPRTLAPFDATIRHAFGEKAGIEKMFLESFDVKSANN